MTPFCVDKLMIDMNRSFVEYEKNVIKYKLLFCREFNIEMGYKFESYGEDLFDFIYNLYAFKKSFNKKDFQRWKDRLRDSDFKNELETRQKFQKMYQEFLVSYKKYFMDYFRLEYDCPDYFQLKYNENKNDFINKMVEYN